MMWIMEMTATMTTKPTRITWVVALVEVVVAAKVKAKAKAKAKVRKEERKANTRHTEMDGTQEWTRLERTTHLMRLSKRRLLPSRQKEDRKRRAN